MGVARGVAGLVYGCAEDQVEIRETKKTVGCLAVTDALDVVDGLKTASGRRPVVPALDVSPHGRQTHLYGLHGYFTTTDTFAGKDGVVSGRPMRIE